MADEKSEEKEMEKHEEKQQDDLLSSVVGAVFLIWLGAVLLAANTGFLDTFTKILASLSIKPYALPFEFPLPFFTLEAAQVFFIGAGVILLFEVVIRLLVPVYRRRVLGTIIGAIIFFSLGLGNWQVVGPLILVAIGVTILFRGFTRRR
ncbi:MAG: hypothetical protein JW918_09495 [Anaerolineae bacterium]|nr:hypothetical protein [Anaerolineae bacterium]